MRPRRICVVGLVRCVLASGTFTENVHPPQFRSLSQSVTSQGDESLDRPAHQSHRSPPREERINTHFTIRTCIKLLQKTEDATEERDSMPRPTSRTQTMWMDGDRRSVSLLAT